MSTESKAEVEPTAPEPTETEIALASEVDQLRTALEEMRTERNAWRDQKLPDPETEAIAGCVKALDVFTSRATSTYSSNASASYSLINVTSVGRILRFLAERYGVELAPNVQLVGPDGRQLLTGMVRDAGGGEVTIAVDRETAEYPSLGQRVVVSS